MPRRKIQLLALAFLAALPFAGLGLAEGAARVPLWRPGFILALPQTLADRYRTYYLDFDRDILQFNPSCAQYDPDLFYTLKPGTCTFRNREFSVTFHINSLGVRDDEASLVHPQVVVLGDSQAMGWAVEQNETFAKVLERQSGMRVLNTAVSSYGTAREMKMLGKVDRSALQRVVIQYCDNDVPENEEFLAHDYVLPIQPADAYSKIARNFASRRKPWLSAYLLRGLVAGGPPAPAAGSLADSTRHEVSAFIQTLAHAGMKWDGVKLTVFEIDGPGGNNPLFAKELRRQLADDTLPAAIRSATVLDFSKDLTPEYYGVLDDHMNPAGHRLVASRILTSF